jgi:hypothetical protein
MKHSDFKTGTEFLTETGRWRCTDVGARTIAAIKLDLDHDPRWYNGPPHAVVEHVFDEDGIRLRAGTAGANFRRQRQGPLG